MNDTDAKEVVKRIFRENWRRYRSKYALAIGCMIIIAAMTAFSAYIIKDVVNQVFEERNLTMAWVISAIVLVLFTVKGFAGFGQEVLLQRIGNDMVARYQARVLDHMMKLGVSFYNENRSSFLVSRIGFNVAGVSNMLNLLITVVARDLLTLVGLMAVMVWQDPVMTAGSFLILPIAAYVISRYVKKMKTMARREVNLKAKVVSSLIECAQGINIVKSFTMENQMQAKIGNMIKAAQKQADKIVLVNARTRPLTETLGGVAIAGAVAFGGWRTVAFDANPGAMLSFLVAAMLAYEPARRLASFRVQFERSLVSAQMLYEILDSPIRQADKPDSKDLKVEAAEIRLENVDFSYQNGEKVLRNISFVAEAGKTTALVGPSGGGKTTIVNLIQRFFDVEGGAILIDNQNIADIRSQSLRSNISYVSQQPVLFEGTVAENIGYGKAGATREEIESAARLAQAHGFISELPLGFETEVGEMGSNFSGGQRQRLSIARAILRNAPILLLDEATSALDNESEQLVQEALDQLMKGRTTLVVAHRLTTIRGADSIVVIDRGRVVESGNHNELLHQPSGLYARLHDIAIVPDFVKA